MIMIIIIIVINPLQSFQCLLTLEEGLLHSVQWQ